MQLVKMTDSRIRSMSTEQLKSELAKGLTMTADGLTHLGAIWMELESRGADLSSLREGIAETLPLIGRGLLAAESVIAFAGSPVLKYLEGINLDEQRRLAAGKHVSCFIPDSNDMVRLPLVRVPSASLRYLFSDGKMRSPAEQKLARSRNGVKSKQIVKHTVKVDKAKRLVFVGKSQIGLGALVSELSNSTSPVEVTESIDRPARTIVGKVTDEEKERVQAAAKAHGITESELVRRAVLAMWLI